MTTTVYAEAVLPLSRAMVCLNTDETVYDVSFGRCPRCGGVGMPLGAWLGSIQHNGEVIDRANAQVHPSRFDGQARPPRGASVTETA